MTERRADRAGGAASCAPRDCGVTRLDKDGIGAAYRTAKAAASAVVLDGISEEALARHYLPACRRISSDNSLGLLAFSMTRLAKRSPLARRAILRMAKGEQARPDGRPRDGALREDAALGDRARARSRPGAHARRAHLQKRVHEDPSVAYHILQVLSSRVKELSDEPARLKAVSNG